MSKDLMEAIVKFNIDLVALGLDRGGLSLEVPKRLFLELAATASRSYLAQRPLSHRRGRFPVRGIVQFEPQAVARAVDLSTSYVELDEEVIRKGLALRLMGADVWTFKVSAAVQAELLKELR